MGQTCPVNVLRRGKRREATLPRGPVPVASYEAGKEGAEQTELIKSSLSWEVARL